MTKYRVTWKEMWAREEETFTEIEKAKEWATMKKQLGYQEVKLEKVEITEIEF
jgi:hypothetical protein